MADTLEAITCRIGELEAQMAAIPLYQEMTILRKARDDLLKLTNGTKYGSHRQSHPLNDGHKRVTISDGVKLALNKTGRPMTARELVGALPAFGVSVGGKNPLANVTSILSKRNNEVKSIRWNGKYVWWFNDRALPADQTDGSLPLADKKTEDPSHQDESSASNHNQGESYAPALDK